MYRRAKGLRQSSPKSRGRPSRVREKASGRRRTGFPRASSQTPARFQRHSTPSRQAPLPSQDRASDHGLAPGGDAVAVHLHGAAVPCPDGLPGAGHGARAGQGPLQAAQVRKPQESGGGFVHRVEADDVREASQTPGHGSHGTDVVPLEPLLEGFALDPKLRGRVVPPEEEGEHRGAAQAGVVGRPDHPGAGIPVLLVEEGGARGVEVPQFEACLLQGPGRGPVPPGPAAPAVLVGVHEEADPSFFRGGGHALQVVQVFLVVQAGPRVLHGLPRDQEAEEVQAPELEAVQVFPGLRTGEGPPDEGDVPPLVEALPDVGASVGPGGVLRAAPQVRSP